MHILSDRKQDWIRHSWWRWLLGTRWFIFPFCKERCSFRLIDFVFSIYKNGLLLVPFLSTIATSADSFASHVLFVSAVTLLSTIYWDTKCVGCCSTPFFFPRCLLLGLICTPFHSNIRPCTLSSRSLQDFFFADTRILTRVSFAQ